MTDNVRRIVKGRIVSIDPPTTTGLSVNDTARDVSLQHALDGVQIDVPAGDSDRIMLLMSLVAEIVDAYRFGHKNITDEYLRLAAATKRMLADDLRGDAA